MLAQKNIYFFMKYIFSLPLEANQTRVTFPGAADAADAGDAIFTLGSLFLT